MSGRTYIRASSGGSLPLTSPRIFCRSGGTSVMLYNVAFKSNTLHHQMLRLIVQRFVRTWTHAYQSPRPSMRKACQTKRTVALSMSLECQSRLLQLSEMKFKQEVNAQPFSKRYKYGLTHIMFFCCRTRRYTDRSSFKLTFFRRHGKQLILAVSTFRAL